ncbi:Ig-like domain-containing protein [Listeria booriae]|uniref:immunoglobulin-like domain-containing protein n=1 Tax=Listeria booriae TaxID=1552123 RepID=UPI00288070AC|nr:immunoglobulin-like domain-containing protein [Listeria booriae]MDT0110807.1 Ig-like domain-containing protein [Listeria booriae]
MTNKKRANKLAKITVASAIALSALAQPLGTLVTVQAAEAPATTKAETKLLTSAPNVQFKNARFESTDTSIPDWRPVSLTIWRGVSPAVYDFSDVHVDDFGTKSYFWFAATNLGSVRGGISPDSTLGRVVLKSRQTSFSTGIQQIIDTVPGEKYTVNFTTQHDILTSVVDTWIRVIKSDEDGAKDSVSLIAETYPGTSPTSNSNTFTATKTKTAVSFLVSAGRFGTSGGGTSDNIYVSNVSVAKSSAVSIATPTINTITDKDTVVTGTGTANTHVRIELADGTFLTGEVGADGKYSVILPQQSVGKVVKATLYDGEGNISQDASTTVISDIVAPPTIKPVTSDDTTVKGTGVNGATVIVTIGSQTYTGTVSGGEYSITIPKQSAGTVVTATESLNSRTSASVSTTVTQGTVAAPTINSVTSDDTAVRGTGINGATVTVTIGGQDYTGTVSGGEYSITIPKQAVGTVISAKQSLNSKTSSSVSTTVTQGTVAAPVINTVTSDDIRVTGTGTKGAVVTLTIAGHDYTGLVDANGAYSITIVKQPAGTTITAKQEINGKSSANATTTVTQGVVTPPTVNPVTTDDIKVTGTGMKGAVVKLTINGTDYTGLVDSDGKYSIDIPKQAEGTGIVAVEIINGTTSTTTIASVTQGTVATPTINSVTTEDTTVKGTGTTGAVVTITIGSNTYTGSVTNGSYSITIPKQAAGTVISAKQTLNNKTSAATTTSVIATQTTLTTNNFTIGVDNYIRGTYTGSSVAKLAIEVNGTVQQKITATGSPYQYYAKGKITAGTDQVYVISYNANGDQLKRVKVDVKTLTSGTITPATFYIGTDNYLTGTLTGDISKFSLTVNGVETTKINVTTAPTFRYYANNLIRNLTDVVTVNGYDSAGKLLDSKPVTVDKNRGNQGAIATVAPFTLGKDSYVTGTYTGDIAKVELQVNNVALQRINVASDGTIKYYAKGKINALTDVVKLVGYDSTGIAVSTKVITVANANGGITVNPYVIGTDGYVKGTYTGSVAKISLTVNGDKKTTISVPVPGPNYQYYAKSLITSASDVVVVTAYNAAGGVLDTKTVSVSSR